jgi:hypothetical protein
MPKDSSKPTRKLLKIFGISIVAFIVLCVGFFFYATAPRYVDHDLFSYTQQPYSKQDVLFSYSGGADYGLAFAHISPIQAKAVLSHSSAIFPNCNKNAESKDASWCTETWVPTTQIMPQMSSGATDKKQLQTMDDLYQKTITKDALCTYSPNPVLNPAVVINDRLCVNPTNGYVMYIYLNP